MVLLVVVSVIVVQMGSKSKNHLKNGVDNFPVVKVHTFVKHDVTRLRLLPTSTLVCWVDSLLMKLPTFGQKSQQNCYFRSDVVWAETFLCK